MAGVLAQPLPWRHWSLKNRLPARRVGRTGARSAVGDETNLQLSVVEQSVDFGEVEFVEVQDRDSCSTFRTAVAAETDQLTFTTEDEAYDRGDVSSSASGSALWILALCTISYLHCSSTGFAIPALLPSIAADSALSDSQGAYLTVGFTMVYALMQIPFGYLADRMNRPKLLSFGIVIWSVVTALASKAVSFSDLLLIRLSTAASQSMMNPIAFGLIPELFPKRRTTAISMYNCALYFGRALSFFFAVILVKLGMHGMMGIHTVPLEQFDVTSMSLLYITGDQATVAPLFDYDFSLMAGSASSWRDLLFWIGIPGLGIGFLVALIDDPRPQTKPGSSSDLSKMQSSIAAILQNRSFQATTLAASLNDIGFWCLISWQALFYERAFNLPSEVYAPLLAAIIPLGGIVGGVGGSLLSDWLAKRKARHLLTFGATLVGAPFFFWSFQATDYQSSFLYLLFGYSFLECWRASAAIMVRESSPPDSSSTGAAVHLFARNLLASVGPILIAFLEPKVGLRNAMCVIPLSYVASAVSFGVAERFISEDQGRTES